MSWVSVLTSKVFVVWDRYVCQPITTRWDVRSFWDDDTTDWDSGSTTWDDGTPTYWMS